MTRLKSVPLAIGGLIVAAGTVAAFTALPDAAGPGLQKATAVSGKTVPVRAVPADVPPAAPALQPADAPAARFKIHRRSRKPASSPPTGGVLVVSMLERRSISPADLHG